MNRRDVLKGLATLPLVTGGLAQVCATGTPCPVGNSLLVWLEGPFAVVLQNSHTPDAGVVAFSPVHQEHLIIVNGMPLGRFPLNHHFHMADTGLAQPLPTFACVSSDFKDFCAENVGLTCDPDSAFVSVTLPCPKNIYTRKLLKGTLPGNGADRDVCIPQDHVLEYDMTNPGKPPALFYTEAGQFVQPIQALLHIAIGLDHPDGAGTHAMGFYNGPILGCFSTLAGDATRKLKAIGATCTRKPLIPEVIVSRLNPFASTLECKSGGILGGNP